MNRRDAILTFLALGASGTPFTVVAQSPRRIGAIHNRGGALSREQWVGTGFVAAMKELGYQEGRDYVYDFRGWQRSEEIPALVRELIAGKAELIIAASPPSIAGAKSVTDRVPIVMMFSANPIAIGLARSLSRPGGNVTGLTWDHGFETYAKQLELFKETLPRIRRVALMWDTTPDSTHDIYVKYYERAAPRLGLALIPVGLGEVANIGPAFEKMRNEKAEALIILPSAQITVPHREAIMALVARDRVPALSGIVRPLFEGALYHSAPNFSDNPRRVAAFVDRIFKGAKPGDLPIEQPTKYDFIVDQRVARKLGIVVPQSVLVRADRVIE